MPALDCAPNFRRCPITSSWQPSDVTPRAPVSSGGLLALIKNPTELTKLRNNMELLLAAVEEMLRGVPLLVAPESGMITASTAGNDELHCVRRPPFQCDCRGGSGGIPEPRQPSLYG
jgi:hypothetical protein